ncbi:MAG: molybdopterin molybdotransferase MoeA [Elusimicrobia bacterium]|nr:molybdopterin molybdotransferase MoeA [Elusimicrobiota bacterium]
MISFNEAFKKVLARAKILDTEKLPTDEALGYILAEDIKAKCNIPPFNKSSMDGYAVRCRDLVHIPVRLKCIDIISAGQICKKTVGKGECVRIMTGSPLPKGTDSVVMVEHTKKNKNGRVEILKNIKQGENISLRGENVRKGKIVLKKGTPIRAPEVSVISALGAIKVKVYRKPTAAIINTGNEIIEPGNDLIKGKIYNSNGPMLSSLLKKMNVQVAYRGIVGDEEKKLKKAIVEEMKNDILLVSGGVSVGDYDLVPSILNLCGVKKIFHTVKIKPGKPVFFGIKGRKIIFGIPGNPVSAYLIFLVMIKPAIEKMMGMTPGLNIKSGILKIDFRQHPGRKHFVPAFVIDNKNQISVLPISDYRGSADIGSLSKANAFMIVNENKSFLKKNSIVKLLLW